MKGLKQTSLFLAAQYPHHETIGEVFLLSHHPLVILAEKRWCRKQNVGNAQCYDGQIQHQAAAQ